MDPVVILFIVLTVILIGGVTYKTVTEPEVWLLVHL
jgi:hypothetical protein